MLFRSILPPRYGGNNTIINLHATNPGRTSQRPLQHTPVRIFDDAALLSIGLDQNWTYPDLTRRDLAANPFSFHLIGT